MKIILSLKEYMIMLELSKLAEEEAYTRRLYKVLNISKRMVLAKLQELEKFNLIERSPSCGRSTVVKITPLGKKAMKMFIDDQEELVIEMLNLRHD